VRGSGRTSRHRLPRVPLITQTVKLIQQIAPLVDGKGGEKPESARGGGKDPSQLEFALAKARDLF
jgi:alanyl-tRNA synthetase